MIQLKIYSDASYDPETKLGCYCIVAVLKNHKGVEILKDYFVRDVDGCTNSGTAELVGLRYAIELAEATKKQTLIYCDSMAAIDKVTAKGAIKPLPPMVTVRHFKGHQIEKDGVVIDDDVKRHAWCDSMARKVLRERLKG